MLMRLVVVSLLFYITSFPFILFCFFSLIIRHVPFSTLFPYTTLFRSVPSVVLGRTTKQPPVFWGDAFIAANHQFFRSEDHTSELQSLTNLVCRLLLEKKKKT